MELTPFRAEKFDMDWPHIPGAYVQQMIKEVPIYGIGLPFENNFDYNGDLSYFVRNYEIWVLALSIFYCVAVHAGIKFMKNRTAFDLSGPLKFWNLFLAVFSLYGAIRTVPYTIYMYTTTNNTAYMCAPGNFSFGSGSTAFAISLFVFSKVFELIDTVFLVIRKKPVGFLHWFHHATVLLFTWDAYANQINSGTLFIAMNYTVHAIMYTYYFLAACGKPPAWGKFVTTIQIVQMVFGSYWSAQCLYLAYKYKELTHVPLASLTDASQFTQEFVEEHGCAQVKYNAWCGIIMYVIYLYLFCEFFVKRYILRSNKPAKKAVTEKKQE